MTDYGRLIVSQLEFYWDFHLRPRLAGLTDPEYFWEPVDGCWSVRRGADGRFVLDRQHPEPTPPPVTTLAWRIVHVGTAMSTRTSTFFGDGSAPPGADMFHPAHSPAELPATAADAVKFLDECYAGWHDAITGLDREALERPLGPKGAYFCRRADGRADRAHQPGGHAPRRRDRRAARPLPGRPGSQNRPMTSWISAKWQALGCGDRSRICSTGSCSAQIVLRLPAAGAEPAARRRVGRRRDVALQHDLVPAARAAVGSGTGTADSSAWVYGCVGCS